MALTILDSISIGNVEFNGFGSCGGMITSYSCPLKRLLILRLDIP